MNFTKHTAKMGESMIRELVASTKGIEGLISLAGGFPAEETFPKKELAEIFHKVVLEEGNDVLQYGSSNGDPKLIDAIAKMQNHDRVKAENVLITTGSTNGIYYFAKCFVEEGDVVLAEAPSFLGSVVSFESLGAEVVGISMDTKGMITDELEEKIIALQKQNKKIKFIYTIPEFQNPTGITMSTDRRRKLIEIAIKYNIQVLEDNPYGELRYTGESPKDLYKMALDEFDSEIVTCVKSFSKVLGPGLRLAYAVGNAEIIHKMCSWTQKVNVSSDSVTQRVVYDFINNNMLLPHIEKIREFYRPRCEKMLESLEKYMPKGVSWTKPEGGMFVWIYLPENLNGDELFAKARDAKVAFIPGSKFYPSGCEKYNEIRLNFSYPSPEKIEKGVKILADLLNTMV